MRKIRTILCLVFATATVCMQAGNIMQDNGKTKDVLKKWTRKSPAISVNGSAAGSCHTNNSAWGSAATDAPKIMYAPSKAGETSAAPQQGNAWGLLSGPDGTQWYYTEDFTMDGYYYASAVITIYDSRHEKKGEISVTSPEGKSINMIQPFGYVTNKFFDRNDKTYEVMVNVHTIGNSSNGYKDSYETQVYNLSGELVKTYPYSAVMVMADINAWTKYQRLLLPYDAEEDGVEYIYIDVAEPVGYGQTEPQVTHTFKIQAELTDYSEGAYLNFFAMDGKPKFVLSHYKKPYVSGYDEQTYEMIVTEDNSYVMETYDMNYNLENSIEAPVEKPEDALYRFAAFGQFSDKDLSKNYYTTDGNNGYVVTFADYLTSTDDYRYSFNVYDADGQYQKTICENVVNTWSKLNDIEGQSDQIMFMLMDGEKEEIQMIDIPSCEKKTLIPSTINEEMITTNLNRYPKGDSYQYAVSMASADADIYGNVIARIGWYNTDLSFDHFTNFNLGPNGELFRPLLNSTSMNPYLFDTDDELEYVFIAKKKKETGEGLDDVLIVANEDGSEIYSFCGDDSKGALRTALLLTENTSTPELAVICYNYNTEIYTLEFEQLPFVKFAKGGDGSQDSPYLVSTYGDMEMIAAEPTACYKLANDIDMDYNQGKWTPISNFTGSIDGDGHSLNNLHIDTNESGAGLFNTLGKGAKIKNLVMVKPVIDINSSNYNAGILAATATGDTITGVHVYDAIINDASGNVNATVGGIIGMASVYSEIQECSFNNGEINVPASTNVGGIAGDTRTSSNVVASAVSGTITATSSVGGMVGTTGKDSKVVDCHANVNINAKNSIGGIVGYSSSRAAITRCYAEGTLTASDKGWDGYSTAGIVGSLTSDWTRSTDVVIDGCVADVALQVADGSDADATMNRIAGFTIANESYEPGETILTELGLDNNYATTSTTIAGISLTSDDATSVNGKDLSETDLNSAFFTTLGYAYGENVSSPWKGENNIPVLYFEDVPAAIVLSDKELSLTEGDTADMTATIYGGMADDMVVESSDNKIVDVTTEKTSDNTLLIHLNCLKAGSATITVTGGKISATCNIMAVTNAINAPVAGDNIQIAIGNGTINAPGAKKLTVYAADGRIVRTANASLVSTASMPKGVYIAVATSADGQTSTVKFNVK